MQVAVPRRFHTLRLVRSLFAAGAFVAAMASASSASAVSSGLDGNTNKPIAGVGHRCGDCHSGGAAPAVAFAGPATLNSGQTGQYTFTVTTGAARAGMAVAATPDTNDATPSFPNVVTLIPGTNTASKFQEVVHAAPTQPSGGKVVFGFSFVAPQYGGPVKLWGVGLAANNNGAPTGDADQLATLNVTIVGPAPPTGSDGGVKDSGVFGPSDGGSQDGGAGDGGAVPGRDGGKISADGSTEEGPDGIPATGDSSCAVAAVGADGVDGGALAAGLFTMIGLVMAQRRRRA
jgi:hypothetical protein